MDVALEILIKGTTCDIRFNTSGAIFHTYKVPGGGTSYSKQYRYVPRKCPCFQPFYSQFALAKTQFYFHNAYKIYPLRYGNDNLMTFRDNSSKIFCKVMPKTDPSIKFISWKSIICIYQQVQNIYYAYILCLYIRPIPCRVSVAHPYHFYTGSASPGTKSPQQ